MKIEDIEKIKKALAESRAHLELSRLAFKGKHREAKMLDYMSTLLAFTEQFFVEVYGLEGRDSFAAQHLRNTEYYQGLLDEIAIHFGEKAYISDDGIRQDSPVRAKMPELVAKLNDEVKRLKKYEVMWSNLKDQLRRDREQGHIQKTARAWSLMQEYEELEEWKNG